MKIDAHFHCWKLARGDYGWLTPSLVPIYRDVTVAEWADQARPVGVTGGILVQAAPTEAETHFLLEQAQAHPMVLGVVGWLDLLALDAPERIAVLGRNPLLKGLRPMLQDIPDDRWILDPKLEPAFEAMAAHGLVLDALIKPVHLPHIRVLAQRHPGLRIVIDHAAKPGIAQGQWQPWADGISGIARETSAVCKLSGLLTEASSQPGRGALQPWVEHVLTCFKPSRVLWGSDWPVVELAASYRTWWEETSVLLQSLGAAERTAILGGNAQWIYRLDVA